MTMTKEIKNILFDPSSLTQRLKQGAKEFKVQCLKNGWIVTDARIKNIFLLNHLFHYEKLYERSVGLLDGDELLILARTFIPEKTLELEPELLQLENKPLGEFLFSHPFMSRSSIYIDDQPNWPAWRLMMQSFKNNNLYHAMVRYSFFYLNQAPLLVMECFLVEVMLRLIELSKTP